jgi:hypothetical protein
MLGLVLRSDDSRSLSSFKFKSKCGELFLQIFHPDFQINWILKVKIVFVKFLKWSILNGKG